MNHRSHLATPLIPARSHTLSSCVCAFSTILSPFGFFVRSISHFFWHFLFLYTVRQAGRLPCADRLQLLLLLLLLPPSAMSFCMLFLSHCLAKGCADTPVCESHLVFLPHLSV